ncbi:hypothetical protein Tco_0740472 [Tanacetum coccineum]
MGIGICICVGNGDVIVLTNPIICVWLPGYTFALQIADVFGAAWFRMILPGYTSALQIADVFGCMVTRLLYRLQMCLVLVLLWFICTCLDCFRLRLRLAPCLHSEMRRSVGEGLKMKLEPVLMFFDGEGLDMKG